MAPMENGQNPPTGGNFDRNVVTNIQQQLTKATPDTLYEVGRVYFDEAKNKGLDESRITQAMDQSWHGGGERGTKSAR